MGSHCKLSYAQLFSFQVLYAANASDHKKKGGFERAILEFDFSVKRFFVQDKDKVILSQLFHVCKKIVAASGKKKDLHISIHFDGDTWEIMPQNFVEKQTIQHLIEDRTVLKCGVIHRKAKTAFKKDERFVVLVPGKLLLFVGSDIHDKHVRYVTSLMGATVQADWSKLVMQVEIPKTKALELLPADVTEMKAWVKAIEHSIDYFKDNQEDKRHGSKRHSGLQNQREREQSVGEREEGITYLARESDPQQGRFKEHGHPVDYLKEYGEDKDKKHGKRHSSLQNHRKHKQSIREREEGIGYSERESDPRQRRFVEHGRQRSYSIHGGDHHIGGRREEEVANEGRDFRNLQGDSGNRNKDLEEESFYANPNKRNTSTQTYPPIDPFPPIGLADLSYVGGHGEGTWFLFF